MKRLGWLVLLISLGLNLGLGYRLLTAEGDPDRERPRFEGRSWHGHGPRPEGRPGPDGPPDMAAADRDSSRWLRIMAGRLRRVAERLDLTPGQMDVFRRAHQENAAGLLAQRREVERARARLHAVISGGAAEPDSVRHAIQDVGRQQAVLDSLITETMLEELKVLEPEQRARYLEILPVLRGSGPGRGQDRGGRHRNR